MKKRPFVLLEILLACTLLTLCAAPLMTRPIELYRTAMNALREVEKQRLADLSFAEVKVDLLNNRIPWKKLPTKKSKAKVFSLPPAQLQIPYCEPESIQRKVVLRCTGEKSGLKGEIIRMIEIEILFEPFLHDPKKPHPPKYTYKTIVSKKA